MPLSLLLPFVVLALAIITVWLPPLPMARDIRAPAWPMVFLVAVYLAWSEQLVQLTALLMLAGLAGVVWSSLKAPWPAMRAGSTAIAAVISLAFALHWVPGFAKPAVFAGLRVSPDALPFTQYLNFDKGTGGLLLLAAYAPRVARWREAGRVAARTGLVLGLTAGVVFGVAMLIGHVRVDLKFPPEAWAFLLPNFFFTCIAEEAFFRGLLQERLHRLFDAGASSKRSELNRTQRVIRLGLPVLVSASVFGLAHFAGGPRFVEMAFLAGLGYSAVYAWTRRIEAAIGVHFAINAIHFVAFTYPSIAG